jgi:hypothetical protein
VFEHKLKPSKTQFALAQIWTGQSLILFKHKLLLDKA